MRKYLIAAALICACCTSSQAVPVVLGVSDDRGANGTPNTDTATALFADNDVYLRVFGDSTFWRATMKYDVSAFSGSTVASAILAWRETGTQVIGQQIDIYGFGDTTGIIDLGDFAVAGASFLGSYIIPGTSASHTLDVTAFVQSLATSGTGFASFLFKVPVEGGFSGADINSSEFGSDPPSLTVDAVAGAPEIQPGTATLPLATLAFSLCLAAGRRRRTYAL